MGTDTVDTEVTVVDTEAMVVMVLDTAGATMASVRLTPSPTMATVVTMVATTVNVRPRLSPTMAMVDMVDTVGVMEATEVTVMATASNMFPDNSDDSCSE